MGLYDSLRISGSALTAQRLRMDVITSNIANAETTETSEGGPYKAHKVVFTTQQTGTGLNDPSRLSSAGVMVSRIFSDESGPRMVYEPDHPNAGPDGFVAYPKVDVVSEMVDMLSATRAYEANVTAVNATKSLAQKAMEIGPRLALRAGVLFTPAYLAKPPVHSGTSPTGSEPPQQRDQPGPHVTRVNAL